MNERKTELINNFLNFKRVRGRIDKWIKGWHDGRMKEWKEGWMNKWLNEWMNEWLNEWMNEWMNEWKNERVNKWMNEYLVIHLSMNVDFRVRLRYVSWKSSSRISPETAASKFIIHYFH